MPQAALDRVGKGHMSYHFKYMGITEIPPDAVGSISYPSNLDKLKLQMDGNSCGVASLEALLKLQFGYKTSQPQLYELLKSAPGRKPVGDEGIGPEDMRLILEGLARSEQIPMHKIISTYTGNGSQLELLLDSHCLPIINRPWKHEDPKDKGNHFETLIGYSKPGYYSFNPANGNEQNFHFIRREDIYDFWDDQGYWYLAAIPKGEYGGLIEDLREQGYRNRNSSKISDME